MKLYHLLPSILRFQSEFQSMLGSGATPQQITAFGFPTTWAGKDILFEFVEGGFSVTRGIKYYVTWSVSGDNGSTWSEIQNYEWLPIESSKYLHAIAQVDSSVDWNHYKVDVYKDRARKILLYSANSAYAQTGWYYQDISILSGILSMLEEDSETMVSLISGIRQTIDIDNTSLALLPYLAAIVGGKIPASLDETHQREYLKNLVALYKIKGTYRSITNVGKMRGYDFDIVELYKHDVNETFDYDTERNTYFNKQSARVDLTTCGSSCETICESVCETLQEPFEGETMSVWEAMQLWEELADFHPIHVLIRPNGQFQEFEDQHDWYECLTCCTGCETSCESSCESGFQRSDSSKVISDFNDAYEHADELTVASWCVTSCETACQDCCEIGCETSCVSQCETTACEGFCEMACQGICEYNCQNAGQVSQGCELTCQLRCEEMCQLLCQHACQWNLQECVPCERGCETLCMVWCELGCETGGCETYCTAGCEVHCEDYCESTGIESICTGTCQVGCISMCEAICQTGCETNQETACSLSCEIPCETECEIYTNETQCVFNSCQTGCELQLESVCNYRCETGCEVACESGCQTDCQYYCQAQACQVACEYNNYDYHPWCNSLGCESSCESLCEYTCEYTSCQYGCELACEADCEAWCEVGFQYSPPADDYLLRVDEDRVDESRVL